MPLNIILPIILIAAHVIHAAATVAILEIIPTSEEVELSHSEYRHLTDELRTHARETLPQNAYKILTRDNILQLIPPDSEEALRLSDASAIEIGRAIDAEYITQGSIGMLQGMLALTVELYESKSGSMIGSFVAESHDAKGLLGTIREKAQPLFAKLKPSQSQESGPLWIQDEWRLSRYPSSEWYTGFSRDNASNSPGKEKYEAIEKDAQKKLSESIIVNIQSVSAIENTSTQKQTGQNVTETIDMKYIQEIISTSNVALAKMETSSHFDKKNAMLYGFAAVKKKDLADFYKFNISSLFSLAEKEFAMAELLAKQDKKEMALDKINAVEGSIKKAGNWGFLLLMVESDSSYRAKEKDFLQKTISMKMRLQKEASITIFAPQATGLAANQSHLPALIQSELVGNFSNYSGFSVLDWERLDDIYDKLHSKHYGGNAEERQDLGQLSPTTHFMSGKITKTPTGYHLQMNVTRTSDKITIASYSETFTFWELDNLTGIRRASLDLMQKMGVTLTAKAQEELSGAATENQAKAKTALARGIMAQRQGTEVAALSYYFQAATFDPSLLQAVNRSSILNANIFGGSIGDNVRNDIAWRKEWVERLKETERFFDNFNKTESMPYTLFYLDNIKQGAVNYQNETVNISTETYLYGSGVWTLSIERALQAVYDGLNATGRKDVWELGRWPHRGVTELNAFAERRKNFSVVFELVNNQNKVIGRQTLQTGGSWGLSWGGRPGINMSSPDRKTLNFQNVRANDITDNLTIRVASVNGTDAETAAINGVLQIRAIARYEADANDRFKFARGEIQGFASRNAQTAELVIPNAIWGDPVISIGNGAFRNAELTSITIGANMVIDESSFPAGFIDSYNIKDKKADVYTYYENKWLNETEKEQRMEQIRMTAWREHEEEMSKRMRTIKFGARLILGGPFMTGRLGSELFDVSYANYDEMKKSKWRCSGELESIGLTLNIWFTDIIAIAAESNYSHMNSNFYYESGFAKVAISSNTINVPVLLRLGPREGGYLEAGFQWGFPVKANATVSSNGNLFKDEFSDFRVEQDHGLVLGLGLRFSDFSMGFRGIYYLTKLDKYGTIESPWIFAFTIAYDFY
ncbi:MAG: PorT family protein [Fibromonadales bacterium]|nr:PorT family protein [Fibromonadales bacterium]